MTEIPIASIIVHDRGRKSFKNIKSLAESIKNYGFIHPIVVEKQKDENYLLIAGERRLRAAMLLGLSNVSVTTRESLSPVERREIELEENLRREDLDWTEEVEIRRMLDEIKREIHGTSMSGRGKISDDVYKKDKGWSIQKTADSFGVTIGTVSTDLKLARFLKEHPEKKEEFKKLPKSAAIRKIKFIEESFRIKRLMKAGELAESQDVILGDCLTEIDKLETNSIDLILTDPPYGVANLVDSLGKNSLMNKKDNLDSQSALSLTRKVLSKLFRVLKPGRHIYFFSTPEHINAVTELMKISGFMTNVAPIIWNKNKAVTIFTGLSYSRSYEMCIFAIKPDTPANIRSLKNSCTDVLLFSPIPIKERQHAFEKPLDLLRYFIQQSSMVGEKVLDPFCGVGSTLTACKSLRRTCLGIEIQEEHYYKAVENLKGKKT